MHKEPFDPYSQWLGLKSPNRPPNYYELLDLPEFESDSVAITQAIEKQAAILQMVTGEQTSVAEELLEEVFLAKNCLTDPEKKAKYDEELRDLEQFNSKAPEAPEIGPPPIPGINIKTASGGVSDSAKSKIKSSEEGAVGGEKIVESSQQEISTSPAAEMQSRIESQRAKEEKDQQFKVIMDRVLWASCGVAFVAIIWVMIVRVSGCNSEPVTIDNEAESDSKIESQKLSPRKNLDRSLVSPLEKNAKKKLKEKKGLLSKNESKPSATSSVIAKSEPFKAIKQTIGFFDFDEPVNETDLLDGLGPIRMTKIKWAKSNDGGHINLSKDSHIYVDSEKAFDNVKALSLLCKFKTGKKNGKQILISVEDKLVAYLENNKLRIQYDSGQLSQPLGNELANNRWHQLGVTIGQSGAKVWLDGKFIRESKHTIPDFKSVKNETEVGSRNNKDKFEGAIDNLGFYWTELTDSEIRSQFAN